MLQTIRREKYHTVHFSASGAATYFSLQPPGSQLKWLDSRPAGDFYLSFTVYPYANGV